MAKIRDMLADFAGMGGAASVIYGINLMHRPAAWIVGGIMAMGAAWLYARAQGDA